ncbi:MAC/perforin domain-containing protein [Pedobacter kyonggii]|uniref:MACPF domain-containing protein n=1 Tax=Pedobacter kyonggii TaxID=1926871 RepID=A0A4Q9HI28_9SPHI|nr:MAC/perforin domain-containing protein [Pedobacter kyonggii]TBO45166.1 hypothetical protein EYS08_02185 [Pedobacter kyonggii]
MKNNYKLKIICLLCVLTALFSNCKKSDLTEEAKLTNNHNELAFAGDNIYDVLGFGYDVTDRFAEYSSTRSSVIDIAKFVREDPGSYLPKKGVIDYWIYAYGENALSYSNRLSQKYTATSDVFGLFKGEFNLSFAGKDSTSSKYVYSSAKKIIEQQSQQIFSSAENLKNNYLTEKFRSDIYDLSPQLFVEKYGTHILTDITLGARFDFNYESQTNNSKREEAAKAGLKYNGLLAIINVTADIETNSVESSSNFNQTVHYRSIGGDGTKGLVGDISLDNTAPKLTVATWQSSCTFENKVLIKIGENGLMPIEELISDPNKKAEIKAYIKQYIDSKKIGITIDPEENYNPLKEGLLLQTPNGKVFSVINGKARHIQDYGTLTAVYNYETVTITQRPLFPPVRTVVSHIKQITNLSDEGVTEGSPIPPGAELLRDSRDGKIYFFESAQGKYILRHIISPEVANKYYFKLNNARNISSTVGFTIAAPIQ